MYFDRKSQLSRRKVLGLTLAGGMALLAAACSNTATPASQPTANAGSSAPAPSQPTAVPAPVPTATPVRAVSTPVPETSGEIIINLHTQGADIWQALADAYTKRHPNVKVLVELKPSDGYPDWLRAQFSAGTPKSSFVHPNYVPEITAQKKFVNYASYFKQPNPYAGKVPWTETFRLEEQMGYDPVTNELSNFNYMRDQAVFIYNRDLFQKAGLSGDPPKDYDDLIASCAKLQQAGIIPFAIEGGVNAFWVGTPARLLLTYPDQFFRRLINDIRAQPDDWNYREGIDDKWKFDPTDPYNDHPTRVTVNGTRIWTHVRAKDENWRADNPSWRAFAIQFKRLLDFAPPGWLGMTSSLQSYSLFLTQKAAITLRTSGFIASFEKDLKALREGTLVTTAAGTPTPTPDPESGKAMAFNYGVFLPPSIKDPLVEAGARTIELSQGFMGIPKKDQQQNDLEMDFLMFFTSPDGGTAFFEKALTSPNGQITGPPLINGVKLPKEVAERFQSLPSVGNSQSSQLSLARGFADHQPTLRAWIALAQAFYTGQMDVDTYLKRSQENLEQNFKDAMDWRKLTDDDLDHPERKVPTR